jgi:hypothetical protein
VTWQVTPRNKIGGFWDEQQICRRCDGTTMIVTENGPRSPEAGGAAPTIPMRVPQATWSSPVTSRWLFDTGFGGSYYGWGNSQRVDNPTRDLIRVVEQCATGCAANGAIPGLIYRSQDFGENFGGAYNWRASSSYVSGRQSLKIGYQGQLLIDDRNWSTNTQNLTYRVNNGVPNQLTESISPWVSKFRTDLRSATAAGGTAASP